MKVLLDPVYTNNPRKCASAVKFKKLVEYTLSVRDDVYFYWLFPDWATDEDRAWLPQSDKIIYEDYPHSKDRMREFQRMGLTYERKVSFQGGYWDADIIVTNRAWATPLIKVLTNKSSRHMLNWSKRIFLIEDMPLMGFKKTVALSHVRASEIQALSGYLGADTTAIAAFWEKDIIVKEARRYLAPAQVKHIRDTMVETSAVEVHKVELKKKSDIMPMLEGERPFTIGYIGRMTHLSKPMEAFDIMRKHWILCSGQERKIRCVISTQSKAEGRVKVPDFVEMKCLAREEFWGLVKSEMDCFVFLSPEEDYSMSLLEPLILGCPAILTRCMWSVPTVGEEYPFFADNVKHAYTLVRAFYEDYPKMYKRFVDWSTRYFQPLLQSRNEVFLPKVFMREFDYWEHDFKTYQGKTQSALHNEITQILIKYADEHGGEIVIFDAIKELGESGEFRHLDEKIKQEFIDRIRLTWATDWNLHRLGMVMGGFTDASAKVGHMVRVR